MKNEQKDKILIDLRNVSEEDKVVRWAVKIIDKIVKSIIKETTDEDIKYELGKAWGIVKEYLNI
jgi:hypothetical protein